MSINWRWESVRKIPRTWPISANRPIGPWRCGSFPEICALPNQNLPGIHLMGLYYWLIGKQRKAIGGSVPSRKGLGLGTGSTCPGPPGGRQTPVGPAKQIPGTRRHRVRGRSGQGRKLFREMDLQWDLEQLDRVRERDRIQKEEAKRWMNLKIIKWKCSYLSNRFQGATN